MIGLTRKSQPAARISHGAVSESLKGIASDGLADMAAKQQTVERPAEILLVVMGRKVDAQLFRIEPVFSAGQGRASPNSLGMQLRAGHNPPCARKWRHPHSDGFQ
jgi:hypothetical protein